METTTSRVGLACLLAVVPIACDLEPAGAPVVGSVHKALIECNGAEDDGKVCDTDNTLCTREVCVLQPDGENILCRPDTTMFEPPGTPCESDGDPCTDDTCDGSGSCESEQVPAGTLCNDGDACTTGSTCNPGGQCVGGTALECDDDNECTTDSCVNGLGCQFVPDVGEACDDGLFCTSGDQCDDTGACTGGSATCVDGNTCTVDSCDEDADECHNTVTPDAPCSDGDSCSENDVCTDQGQCVGTQKNDGSECTTGGGCATGGTCGPDGCTGTTPIGDGEPCDDGDECTREDLCTAGVCGGPGRFCFDDDGCTSDVCDSNDGCVYEPFPGCGPSDAGPQFPDAAVDGGPDGILGGGGCGCRAGGVSIGLGGLLLFLLVAGLGPGRRWLVVLLAALALIAPQRARADDIDAQMFTPSTSSSGFFSQHGAEVLGDGVLNLSAGLDLGTDLLQVRDRDTGEMLPGGDVLSRRLSAHLGVSLGLFNRYEVGFAVPITLAQKGDLSLVRPDGELAGAAAGDLRVEGKVHLLQSSGIALAALLGVTLPTGDGGAFSGAAGPTATPRVIVGVDRGPLAVAVNVGYRVRDAQQVAGLTVDDEVVFGAGARFQLMPKRLWVVGEAYAAVGVMGDGREEKVPAEVLGGARVAVAGPWTAQGGFGVGLTHGYGAPAVRGVLSFAYAPQPEPPPPPPPPPPLVEEEEEPPPPPDSDGDGLLDPDDQCPTEPEDFDDFKDEDGCPDPDNDGDKILDADDECPNEAEVVNGVEDTDGCPDEGLIVMVEDRIVLEETVLFDVMRARVKRSGRPMLQAIITLWKQHPEWDKMVIEGHADNRGKPEYNQWLSDKRARRVREAMIQLGMPADKVEAVGYGETRPRDDGTSDEAYRRNRRVEFVIVDEREELKVVPGGAADPAARLDTDSDDQTRPTGGSADVGK